jgi:hypothetical protein
MNWLLSAGTGIRKTPSLSELADLLQQRFGKTAHLRSIERALARRRKAYVTIRSNQISMQAATPNGKLGILEYGLGTRATGVPTVIADNTLDGCGIMADDDEHVVISGNAISDYFLWMKNLTDLVLTDNSIKTTTLGYLFRNVTGRASGNTLNGAPVEFPLTSDQPYGN